jgi:hypothetical protein
MRLEPAFVHYNPCEEACNTIPGPIALLTSIVRIAKEPDS